MIYLLDTCTVSDFAKGQPNVLSCIKATPPSLIAISSITRMELEYGLKLNPQRAAKLAPVMNVFLSSIKILPFSDADAHAAGAIRAALRQKGTPIGPYDILIAGSAIAHGLTVVTSNTGEFSRIDGLTIEDWR